MPNRRFDFQGGGDLLTAIIEEKILHVMRSIPSRPGKSADPGNPGLKGSYRRPAGALFTTAVQVGEVRASLRERRVEVKRCLKVLATAADLTYPAEGGAAVVECERDGRVELQAVVEAHEGLSESALTKQVVAEDVVRRC